MILHVQKHPSASVLANCEEAPDNTPAPEGWEAMAVAEFTAWRDAEIANGWAPPEPEAVLEPVPQEVGSGQIRAALVALGWVTIQNPSNADAEVDAWAASLIELAVSDPAQKTIAHLLWKNASVFKRQDAFVLVVAAVLQKTSDETDTLFRTAATF